MKKSLVKIALTTLFAFVFVVTNLPANSFVLSVSNPSASASMAEDLKKLCQCVKDPLTPLLNPAILPPDVSLKSNKSGDPDACTGVPGCLNSQNGCCQPCFDCYGWQLLIAMNWPTQAGSCDSDSGAYFGRPGDYKPVVWERFKSDYDIFSGKEPTPWCTEAPRELRTISKDRLSATQQADHNWLTAWDTPNIGRVVRYEIRVNKLEFDYIVGHNLWNQQGLSEAFNTPRGGGIDLPNASMEVKAAWRVVPKGQEKDFEGCYKVTKAMIPFDDNHPDGAKEERTVALVGQHIIIKTPNSPQWVWATFEHKNNAPDAPGGPNPTDCTKQWNFNNPAAPRSYTPNYDAPPTRNTPKNAPVQVVRVDQKMDPGAKPVNDAMHELIRSKYKDSVWLNYNLISVQWPSDPAKPSSKSASALRAGKPRPLVLPNLTMETYQQTTNSGGGAGLPRFSDPDIKPEDVGKSSCIGCHRLSAILPNFASLRGKPSNRWWTDYSTIFFKAKALP
jgi:hypothetical protein